MGAKPEMTPGTQVEPYVFSKDKLRKELSYPLKRSLLDGALHSASVYETVWFVRYLGRQNGNTVLDVYFSPEQYRNAASGKVVITIWAVPAKERHATEKLLLNHGVSALCRWLARAQSEGNAWRGFGHSLTFERAGETLRYVEH